MNTDLDLRDLHASLTDPDLLSVNFLNEVALRFPDAVSFAAGRPVDDHFEPEALHRWLDLFLAHRRAASPDDGHRAAALTLFQYGPTKGIIQDLVVRHLRVDEGIDVPAESIVMTVGCQEAIYLVLRALRRDDRDAVLAVAPAYVGFTGACKSLDLPVFTVRDGDDGIDLNHLEEIVRQVRAAGLRPRACYVMPDFANPSGRSMETATRHQLLATAFRLGLLLIEDNPYGFFGTPRRPTLKALDTEGHVIYLGSFAKTVFPGARVGYVVADQRITGAGPATSGPGLLADELAKLKSMISVNTSPIAQAIVGGRLIEAEYDLRKANSHTAAVYRRNLARVLAGLERRFGGPDFAGRITWNTPEGGFFLVLQVPRVVDDALLELSARQYGVIWTPMSYFFRGEQTRYQMRLSISHLDTQEIEIGLDRLAALLTDRRNASARVHL